MTRIVSLNAGLLSRLAGLVAPAPFVESRARALPRLLAALAPDVVVLQEVYDREHHAELAEHFAGFHVFGSATSTALRLGAGLVVLARSRGRSRVQRLTAATRSERLLARREVLVVELDEPVPWVVVDVHTTAGGTFGHPEAAHYESIRDRQIREILALTTTFGDRPTLVAGDFNCGPGVSQRNYDRWIASGWVDLFAAAHPGSNAITWDPRNPLNRNGAHRHCPPQRIDHAFARASDLAKRRIAAHGCEITLTEAVVPVATGLVTPSDHCGLVLDLTIT